MKKFHFVLKELLATFWFLPVLILVSSVFLSVGLVYLDSILTIPQEGWTRLFLVTSSDSARSILSTISGAMIGVAGTVFSVTLVALTLASSQFGPRLIKNFMYVRLNQVVLGSYISTYLYCLLVLNSVKAGDDYHFIPSISILVAILAAIANIILLIVFIHQIASSIQADKVISEISAFIARQVTSLFPEKIGEGKEEEEEKVDQSKIAEMQAGYHKRIPIKSPKSGYLQYIASDSLMNIVCRQDAILEIYHRPGGYLVEGMMLGLIYSKEDWEVEDMNKVYRQFVIGKTKTAQQDLEFSIHQMVEIAVRALSPGVNDPFTALTCIDNLTATMSYLAKAKFPSKYRLDEDGKLRIIADALDFEGVLDAAFNQIRQFSSGTPAVIIRLMEALTTIQQFIDKDEHRKAVIKHAEMTLRIGKQSIKEENDLADLIIRVKKILG